MNHSKTIYKILSIGFAFTGVVGLIGGLTGMASKSYARFILNIFAYTNALVYITILVYQIWIANNQFALFFQE